VSVSSREGMPGITAPDGLPAVPGAPDAAGRLLGRVTVLPALLTLPFLLISFPLLFLGWFKPAPVIVLWLLLAAVIVPLGWRWIPAPPDGSQTAGQRLPGADGGGRTPWWTIAALLAVAFVFGADSGLFHSQFIIIMRDPASYFQFATWISRHGSLPIPQDRAAFGGPGSLVAFDSFAYYSVHGVVVPQFMAGLPMVLSVGFWTAGTRGALLTAPLLGAAAVLTFGGLAARLIGPRWAPLAALVLALSLPQEFTSRTTYSEPLAQILFLGGLSLAIDALRLDPAAGGAGAPAASAAGARRTSWRVRRAWPGRLGGPRMVAGLAGLALGITLLVRLDGPSDILPVIPFCGMLLLGRRRQAWPLFGGLTIGLAYGAVDALVLTRPYLRTNISSVKPMAAAFVAVVALTAAAVLLLWRRGVPRLPGRLADLAALLPFAVTGIFVVRPYLQKDWRKLQYAPISLHWVFWYLGVSAVVLATIGAALLVRACLRGQAPASVLPLMVFSWTITEFLYRPAITPDQPWASRRLVPAVLPGFILLAVWLAAWVTGRVRRLGFAGLPSAALAVCCAAALIVPTVMTTFGLGLKDTGPQGLRLVADGMAFKRTYVGEVAAVNGLCAALPPDASVVIIDGPLADRMSEVIRGMCGVPAARLRRLTVWRVTTELHDVERAGRRPVLLFAHEQELKPYLSPSLYRNGTVRKVMTLNTKMDPRIYLGKPRTLQPLAITAWIWEPGR
jgi:hypothetical protein